MDECLKPFPFVISMLLFHLHSKQVALSMAAILEQDSEWREPVMLVEVFCRWSILSDSAFSELEQQEDTTTLFNYMGFSSSLLSGTVLHWPVEFNFFPVLPKRVCLSLLQLVVKPALTTVSSLFVGLSSFQGADAVVFQQLPFLVSLLILDF